ncbi:hypothetical protein SAMN05216420_104184 [Nitrosospira sp. Nl5]|nr:hypothetical protein SAMN05216420_104184 [Nitrosospira sp. Nl5]
MRCEDEHRRAGRGDKRCPREDAGHAAQYCLATADNDGAPDDEANVLLRSLSDRLSQFWNHYCVKGESTPPPDSPLSPRQTKMQQIQ